MTDQEEKEQPVENGQEEGEGLTIKAKKNVFVRSDEHEWLPARIVEQNETEAVVQVFDLQEGGGMVIRPKATTVQLADYPPQNALPLKNVNEYGDMIDLPFLHEPGILYNLRSRFFNDRPYTRTGDILIAVNPYQWLSDIYTTQKRKQYMPENTYDPASGMVKKTMEPHVYEISAMAFRGLAINKKNQSILVSGESGAGKTETVKICLDHIATIQGGLKRGTLSTDSDKKEQHQVMSDIVQRVVDSNPLLEAFGNAKTVRNDNSSRFGKFVQLQFDQSAASDSNGDTSDPDNYNCNLVGSHIEVYLLEKSRVVSHAAGERNFHIFYQLLAAPDKTKRQIDADVLLGKSPASFPYLGNRDMKGTKTKRRASFTGHTSADGDTPLIESMSDLQWFEHTVSELGIIGVKDELLWTLMRALCVVLQLSLIKFEGDAQDHAVISERQMARGGEFEKLANLMGIDVDVLSSAFTNKTIMAGSTEISSPLTPQQAKEGCDAYAKDLYSKIFSWLVGTINAATSASSVHSKSNGVSDKAGTSVKDEFGMIGVLDIFGFEAFETNHFEQLCINYANERLQYMFASNVFVSLIDEYAREGLVVDFSYETNTNVLDLISGKTGILATLNEECIRPGGNDIEFVYKAINQNKDSPRLFKTDLFTRYQFGIRHYAGPVVYTAKEFLSTNKDIMPIDLQKVSRSSTNSIIASEYAEPTPAANGGRPAAKGMRSRTNMNKNTVISKFRTQLNSLMKTLSDTQTRYIRCIKPNRMKQPHVMEHGEIMRQLQSGGVIAAIKIASASYPNKMEHHAVLKRFRNLGEKPDPSQDIKTQVSTLMATALKDFVSPIKGGTPRPPTTVGETRTYFRTGALEYLENARNENIGFFAIIIQRSYRMAPVRRSFLRQRKAAVIMQALIRGYVWKKRVERMPACAVIIQRKWCAVREIIRAERRLKSTIQIQRMARGYIQYTKFQKELAEKTSAVILLQKTVRGFIQKAKFRVILKKKRKKEKKAAVKMQRIVRGHQQRLKFQIMLEEEKVRKNKAAVQIERIARGYIQVMRYRAMLKAEQERIAAEKAAEEARIRAEKLAAEKAAEEERLAAEKAAEEARLKAEKLAEEKRIAAEKRAEEEKLEAERLAAEKLAAEKAAEEERLAAERKAEEKRLKAEKRKEEKRLAAEKKAEEKRLKEEKKRRKEEKRLAAEKKAAEKEEKKRKKKEKSKKSSKKKSEEDVSEAQCSEAPDVDESTSETNRVLNESSTFNNTERAVDEDADLEKAIQSAQAKAEADNALTEEPDEDEELALALEMALLAGQNPDVAPEELNRLLGKPALVQTDSSSGGFLGRMMGGFRRMTAAKPSTPEESPIVIGGAPWEASDHSTTLGNFFAKSVANKSRRGSRDDDTYAESVMTMMLPDSLTAEQLRSRREDYQRQQETRKTQKKISEKSRELRKLRLNGERVKSANAQKRIVSAGRRDTAVKNWKERLQKLPYEDTDMEAFTTALEEESVKLGQGTFEEQKEQLSEEEKMQFDVQMLQETQLVRQMQLMHVVGDQKYLDKKHEQSEMEYLKSCQTWLADKETLHASMKELENLMKDMRVLYQETLRRQEAAFARHDADMTIRETIEDIF